MESPRPGPCCRTSQAAIHPEESFENLVLGLLRNTYAFVTDTDDDLSISNLIAIAISPPSGEYLTAFSTRLRTTCSIQRTSASTTGKEAGIA
jgi:hypothetical protein